MGLLSGLLLAREGASVQLVELNACGQEASWAGGRVVSPLYPWCLRRRGDGIGALVAGLLSRAWRAVAGRDRHRPRAVCTGGTVRMSTLGIIRRRS
ncbi:TPA: hypothetical protein ACP310_003524 [Pseudomonas aeruginosa]